MIKINTNYNYRQHQKQEQKLAMTLSLQQSIQMLQKTQEELSTFVIEKANENPLFEVEYPLAPISFSSDHPHTSLENISKKAQYSSLFDYILDEIRLNFRDTPIRQSMFFLAQYIDPNGYLTISLEQAQEKTNVSYTQLLDALTLLQQLEPAGIAARNLRECLMLQTERNHKAPILAYIILEEHFDALVNRQFSTIAKFYHITLQEVEEVLDFIKKLDPRPGSIFSTAEKEVVIPEVYVQVKKNQTIALRYLKKNAPKVIFQKHYFEMMQEKNDPEVNRYLLEKKQEFDWIKNAMDQREDTILAVCRIIVEYQRDFFLDETTPLKSCTLKEVAQKIGVHESTVSRAVNGKYLKTRQHIYELKYFFPTKLKDTDQSSQEIQQKMIAIIKKEDKTKPLSDDKVSEILKKEKINISRRTVAKYRKLLNIPSSSKRKRFS